MSADTIGPLVVLGMRCKYQSSSWGEHRSTSYGQRRWHGLTPAIAVMVTHDEAGAAWCVSVYQTALSTRSRLQLLCESAATLAEAEDLVMAQWESIKSAMAALRVGP